MKRIIVWMAAAAVVVSAVAVTAQQQSKSQRAQTKSQRTEVREQRHEERVKRRAERLAAFEKHMDSIILSRNFQFNPSSMQRQPAGPVRQLINPNFTVGFCLPYIKGYVPPYYYTVLNYVLPSVEGYRAEQTNEGWIVTFSTTLFSANDYTFTFDIYSSSGGANLTISSVWYNPVQYSGTITQVY